MDGAHSLAHLAAMIGEPARARILNALMGGIALTASELADEADVTLATASAHLAKLRQAGLLAVHPQGRHRYHRLQNGEVAQMLETLLGVAHGSEGPRRRPGPRQPDLRRARVCYDHLAGEIGVELLDQLQARSLLAPLGDGLVVTEAGADRFGELGIDVATLVQARRPVCRTCLDWSERRMHLAGSLGAALLKLFCLRQWAHREPTSRVVTFSPSGARALSTHFGVTVEVPV